MIDLTNMKPRDFRRMEIADIKKLDGMTLPYDFVNALEVNEEAVCEVKPMYKKGLGEDWYRITLMDNTHIMICESSEGWKRA